MLKLYDTKQAAQRDVDELLGWHKPAVEEQAVGPCTYYIITAIDPADRRRKTLQADGYFA